MWTEAAAKRTGGDGGAHEALTGLGRQSDEMGCGLWTIGGRRDGAAEDGTRWNRPRRTDGEHAALAPRIGPFCGRRHRAPFHWGAAPVRHSVGLLFLYGALDSHPFFPSHVASGRCFLSAAAAGALAGVLLLGTPPHGGAEFSETPEAPQKFFWT